MPSRNEEYYLDDIVFQVSHHLPSVSNHYTGNNKVEDELFKVHRHLFVNLSPVFRDMYTIPVAKEDGISDDRPLVLEGIEKKDFTQLLRCLYPLQVVLICSQSFSLLHSSRQFGDHNLEFSVEEWQSVLKLASLYEMTEVKALIIKKMTPLLTEFPSLQINLAKTYNIRTWLAPGLSRLACRAEPLNEDDVKLVGLTDSLTICALRERKRRCEKCTGSCGEHMHTGGFTLREFGQAFGFSDSELPPSYERCVCPPVTVPPWPLEDTKGD